jgi:hypothetical protein
VVNLLGPSASIWSRNPYHPANAIRITHQLPNLPYVNTEDGGSMFLRNVGIKPDDYTAQQPRRQPSEQIEAFQKKMLIKNLDLRKRKLEGGNDMSIIVKLFD